MILHILSDDKFSDYAISQFSSQKTVSDFIVISYTNSKPKFIKQTDKVICTHWKSDEYSKLLNKIQNYKAVILHGLFNPWMEEIIQSTPASVKIAWVFWGGEIYGRPDLRGKYITLESRLLISLRKIYISIKGKVENDSFFISKGALQKINYCLTDIPEDFEFVRSYLGNTQIKKLWYNYYSIEETIGRLSESSVTNNNILVGNSCTIENNHLAAFRKISKFDIANRKIIVPLSYGSPWLKRYLQKKGSALLGESFYPLTDFLDRDTYNTYLLSCSVVIMNHYRHQAMGNIISALWLGSRVYLSKKSTTFAHLKNLGVKVFSFDDELHPRNYDALNLLQKKELEHNRQILAQEYGKENMQKRIEKIIAELTN